MKTSIAIACIGTAALLMVTAAELMQISTKQQNYPERHLAIQRTYRGSQCIMLDMTDNGKRTRGFVINGKTMMTESDENGDGFFESFMIFDPETSDFEWFARTTNNIVTPVSSEKLLETKSKKSSADNALSNLIESIDK